MKSGKVWGSTAAVFSGNNVEIHRIEVADGGYCSKHRHLHKWNMFHVERGSLLVEVWKKDYDLCDTTVLRAGEATAIAPGEYHRFKALTDVVAYEVYWVELDPSDIARESVGGIKEAAHA